MNRLLNLTGAVLIGVLLQGGASKANVLLNSGFESGDFTNWAVNTGGEATYPQVVIAYNQPGAYPTGAFGEPIPTAPNGGNYGAYFVSDNTNESISQSISLTQGQSYQVSFEVYSPTMAGVTHSMPPSSRAWTECSLHFSRPRRWRADGPSTRLFSRLALAPTLSH
ncbi:hypothetical protein ACF1BQ_004950 [Bradyrhizobium sp. RDT10]